MFLALVRSFLQQIDLCVILQNAKQTAMASSSTNSSMPSAHDMGLFSNVELLQNNPHLQAAMQQIENDPQFSEEAMMERMQQSASREKPAPTAASIGSSTENVPDVISFGFSQLVFQFLSALQVRFPKVKPITKAYELFWPIVEQQPGMPHEKFCGIVDAIGASLIEKAIAAGDKTIAKKQRAAEKANKVAKLRGEVAFKLFEDREALRKRLGDDPSGVSAEDKQTLYNDFEEPVLRQVITVDLFRLAGLDRIWKPQLDLATRDRMCDYLKQLCQVTNLINNFDPTMKTMMSKVSLDSVNAAKGRNNGQVDINELLDELQSRLLDDPEFMEKVSEMAMNQ